MKQRSPSSDPPVETTPECPDRSPEGLRATADRIEGREGGGFIVPGSGVKIYAEALRALASERENG